jgi:hypothetical protein
MDMREEENPLGFSEEGKLPPKRKVYTCMNTECKMFNYPQNIEGLADQQDHT